MKDEIFKLMGERAYKRQTKNTYRIGEMPHKSDLDNRTILGSFTWYTPIEHMRYLHPLSIENIGHGVQSQPEIARDYIAVKFGKPPAIKKMQLDELQRKRNAPLLSIPGTYPDMVYIDIKSAYWSIMRIVGWDVDYMPGKWLTFRSDVEDFPAPQLKVARSTLVSLTQASSMNVWTGSRQVREQNNASFANSALWALIFDVLNGVGGDMLELGAKYVHTDGYMLPKARAEEAIHKIAEWGLPAGIKKEGDAQVTTVGVYRIGTHQTLQRVPVAPAVWHKVDDRWREWLRPRMKYLSRYRVDKQGIDLI